MLKLFKYLKPYIWLIIPLIILIYLQVMANLSLPDLMAKIVDNGIIGGDMNAIIKNGLIMLGVTLGGGIAAVGVGF
jgi:ATP-binding cassette subfamily B protein